MARELQTDFRSHTTRRLLLAGAIGAVVLAGGTLGYMFLENWNFVDSLYMTIITLSTVGYGETNPLSDTGKLYTGFLIIIGVGGATYFFTTLVRVIIEGELLRIRGVRKMKKDISKYSDHIIVCGCGRLGKIVVKELIESEQKVVVIEIDPETIAWLEREGVHYVDGTAYEDTVLHEAGIDRAKTLLALLPLDADNVYVTLCARDLNPDLFILARTEDESGEKKLLRAGANQVLAPYRVTGSRVVQRLVRPHVSDFLELAAGTGGQHLVIEELVVPDDSRIAGKTLEEADLRNRTGAVIAAFIETNGEMVFNPGAKNIIKANTTMIVMGERAALDKLSEVL